jgi:lipopolysaccharide export system protein LptA
MDMKKIVLILVALCGLLPANAQKIIQYSSGMGARAADNGNLWILYRGVKASHEGMTLTSDSAHYDIEANNFYAFRKVKIQLTDTTTIYGNQLIYDADTRVLDIWADTVVLIDGSTILKANHLTYDRNQSLGYYDQWGHTTSKGRTLDSRQGYYNSQEKEFYIYDEVKLSDSSSLLITDYLNYNTQSEVAHFESPTYIYTDSSVIYSELGDYHTKSRFAISYKESFVSDRGHSIESDTLYYDSEGRFGEALGNVRIIDSTNNITCTGRYGETNQNKCFAYVTDSAMVVFVDEGDSLYVHADTVYITTDTANNLQTVRANYKVKVFRHDAQAMCDSLFYSVADSTLSLFKSPVLWYEHYQCTADTIETLHDSAGVKRAYLRSNCFAIQQVDREKYNQLKGKQGIVYFTDGEPNYADIKGNAEMVYYITEDDEKGRPRLVGVNVGIGTDMRIYFDTARAPERVVTYDNPDMQTYPVMSLPEEKKRLQGFKWLTAKRPRKPLDIFRW